ncbi:hypothetical protein LCGC14_1046310 [marine sediment metagenome]|uniref:Radical SAM core domain-containing protein n=1 Tax=marine sediment metagenome TaxID=412755 RepID=A0A0F9Q8C2_9ZZZZ
MVNINSNLNILWKKEDKKEVNGYYKEYRKAWHKNPADGIVSDFPLFLDVEATSLCNLKCPHCVQTHANFEKGFMSFTMYKEIIDEASENQCRGVKFHTIGRGEPLLHQRLPEMVAYAVKNGLIDTLVNTNAVLLTKDRSKRLLDAGLHRISFSIDHYIPHMYNDLRPGADLKKVYENVSQFFELREKGNYNTQIRVQAVKFLEMSYKRHQRNYVHFWKVVCDEIAIIDYKEMNKREYGLKGSWICPQPWQRLSVLYSGEILPCNHDDRMFAALGNFENTSLRKVWQSSEMNFIRNAHKTNKAHILAACSACYLRTSELNKEE